ncbi:hypothetical protein [Microbacterium sp. No. 7]|uniref:hypothetical protein n=1 Tax=Microbacterium sp. No. 7 TaxID=1714373 RepID=UPI0006ED0255|nr:hypothetical protein [Microbacterium sp. No. 7]ALJ18416.1 hypothetical protein AOA12_00165 [Microbacterium sp. No. 7]
MAEAAPPEPSPCDAIRFVLRARGVTGSMSEIFGRIDVSKFNSARWLSLASGATFDSLHLSSVLAAFLALAVTRMLTELTPGSTTANWRFPMKQFPLKMQAIRFPRRFWQYALETVWVLGTGAMVGPLAC